ncbi:MAG: site-specific integrase [Clostridia bacterium]|nr:site-specific integrase [Clostridia bacterium]
MSVNEGLYNQLENSSQCESSNDEKWDRPIEIDKTLNKIYTIGYWHGKNHVLADGESQVDLEKEQEEMMKYKGITIHKHTRCSTYYARFKVGKKQYYVTAYTQKECYDKLKKAKEPSNIAKLLNEQRIINDNITLDCWFDKWLSLYKIGKVKDNTLRDYRTLYKNVPNSLKKKELKAIKLDDLLELINGITSSRQGQKLHELFSMIFKKAVDNDLITKNFMTMVDKPKHKKVHSTALTIEQQNKLIEICRAIPNGDVMLVALYQGFRRGEVLGLTRDCIDYANKRITINKAWSQDNQFTTTKNEHSKRTIPMFDNTYNILLKYKDLKPNERVFDLSTKQYELFISRIKKATEFDSVKFKDMRCTFITNCMNNKIPVHIIQSWVGHSIGSLVTTSVYTTHNEEADKEFIKDVNKFSKAFA